MSTSLARPDRSPPRFAAPLAALLLAAGPLSARAADGPAHGATGHDHAGHGHGAASAPSLAEAQAQLRRARASLPPPPPGVTDLAFAELFGPIGARGLEYSEKARALAGKAVRILGYMVSQDQPVAGTALLAPFPFQLHESEYGFAEDLPATLVHVLVPDRRGAVVPHTPGLLLLTGDLSIGPREEPDGRVSTVRLALHPRPADPFHPAPPTKEKKR